jgi:AcrR family transcriptional regulator
MRLESQISSEDAEAGKAPAEPVLAGSKGSSRRRDSVASRGRLLAATGKLLAERRGPHNLQQIASEAGLSAATAYRHFGSVDDALQAYAHQTVLMMRDFAAAQQSRGLELLRAISVEWVQLSRDRGPAMVHLRSKRGFLERRRDREPVITDTCAYLEPAIQAILADLELPAGHLEYALYLWNVMFDPREILDLSARFGWPAEELTDRLLATYIGGLKADA